MKILTLAFSLLGCLGAFAQTNFVAVNDLRAALTPTNSIILNWTSASTGQYGHLIEAKYQFRNLKQDWMIIGMAVSPTNYFEFNPVTPKVFWTCRVRPFVWVDSSGTIDGPNSNEASIRTK